MLNDWQLERLCSIVYLDGLIALRGAGSLGKITGILLKNGITAYQINRQLPCNMTKDEWHTLLAGVQQDRKLAGLWIIKVEDVKENMPDGTLPGHRTVTFTDGNDAYIIFRGTSGDAEWHDNALGMTASDTPQQQAAVRSVEKIKKTFRVKHIVTAGHSKGGNKAQYAAIITDCVDRCFSLDGQGFSKAFIEKYAQRISTAKDKITFAAERRDFINCLGFYAAPGATVYYTGYRGDPTPEMPFGNALPYFHCPNALREASGQIGPVSNYHPISEIFNKLTTYFLTEPRYEKRRQNTAADIVTLLMKNKTASPIEIAEALANLAAVFMDLVCHDKDFRKDISGVFLQETNVLLATLDAANKEVRVKEGGGSKNESLLKLTAPTVARRIAEEPSARRDFFCALEHLMPLIREIRSIPGIQKKLAEYLADFIREVILQLAAKPSRIVKKVGEDISLLTNAMDKAVSSDRFILEQPFEGLFSGFQDLVQPVDLR